MPTIDVTEIRNGQALDADTAQLVEEALDLEKGAFTFKKVGLFHHIQKTNEPFILYTCKKTDKIRSASVSLINKKLRKKYDLN